MIMFTGSTKTGRKVAESAGAAVDPGVHLSSAARTR